jgi:hypothetical protein
MDIFFLFKGPSRKKDKLLRLFGSKANEKRRKSNGKLEKRERSKSRSRLEKIKNSCWGTMRVKDKKGWETIWIAPPESISGACYNCKVGGTN